MRQSVAQISAELGIHVVTLYNWRKVWRLQGEVVPASEKEPEGWSAADKFTVVMETAGLERHRTQCLLPKARTIS
jgi:transposase-like protein